MNRTHLLAIIAGIAVVVALVSLVNRDALVNRAAVPLNPQVIEPAGQTNNQTGSQVIQVAEQTQATGQVASPSADQPAGTELKLAELTPALLSIFAPLPAEATPGNYPMSEELVQLGRLLFHDPRLSSSQRMSCATCHPLDRYGADGLTVSMGRDNVPVKRNAQTVYNAALHIAQFWDGRSPSVEEQAKIPIVSTTEMALHQPSTVEAVLGTIPGYTALFASAFPNDRQPITYQNVGMAIGAFERRLITPSRFDSFLVGDRSQLNEQEQQGLQTFIALGCVNCHMGTTIGGLLFKKLGDFESYPTSDVGRFEVTQSEQDRYVFKVAGLRNVAKTAPYLHDGSVATLQEMVRIMARYQLGHQVTDAQVADVVAFLNTLTGELPPQYVAVPPLPPSGPNTAKVAAGNS
jgi:cytochrome c peroxidase